MNTRRGGVVRAHRNSAHCPLASVWVGSASSGSPPVGAGGETGVLGQHAARVPRLGVLELGPAPGQLGVVDREVTKYHPLRKNIWSAVKQRSGIALEMMPVPLYGIFIATAVMMRYSGGAEEVISSVWFYTMLAMAPIYTAPIVILRILKDSNLLAIDSKRVRVQFLGDSLDEALQKVGFLGGITALFQITVVLSPSISSAWALMLVIIPTISGLVLAYMFLTAFVYLGFHPRLVKRLNAAMWNSPLPKYDVRDADGRMSITPLGKDKGQGSDSP